MHAGLLDSINISVDNFQAEAILEMSEMSVTHKNGTRRTKANPPKTGRRQNSRLVKSKGSSQTGEPTVEKPLLSSSTNTQFRELRHRLSLTQGTFSRLLAISVRTLATIESGSPPSEAAARKFTELDRLTRSLVEVIHTGTLAEWLNSPNKAFDGLKPVELIERGEVDRLWAMIYFLRSGVPV